MSEQFSRWDPVDQLQSEEDMAMYLDACLEEDPGDGSVVRAALNDIARAQGMTQLAKATGITREGLYKALSPTGNPEFSTILKVIKALKIKLHASAGSDPLATAWARAHAGSRGDISGPSSLIGTTSGSSLVANGEPYQALMAWPAQPRLTAQPWLPRRFHELLIRRSLVRAQVEEPRQARRKANPRAEGRIADTLIDATLAAAWARHGNPPPTLQAQPAFQRLSRRKRSSLAEDLFDLAALLPWWACLILAFVSYVLLHPHAIADVVVTEAPDQLTTMVTGVVFKSLANVGQYALPLIFSGAALASFFGRRKRASRARNVADNASGSALTGMIENARGVRPVATPAAMAQPAAAPVAASGESPTCPKCGNAMARRTARQGARAGASFWGCSAFPKCRGVRAID
jgi:probable addiction module antidote protein